MPIDRPAATSPSPRLSEILRSSPTPDSEIYSIRDLVKKRAWEQRFAIAPRGSHVAINFTSRRQTAKNDPEDWKSGTI